MSDLILAAMFAAAVLLPASIVAHRVATAPPEDAHAPGDCAYCAAIFKTPHNASTCAHCGPLRHPANRKAFRALSAIPRPTAPLGSRPENGGGH
ncbi:hypothetical protein ABZ593_21285 [Streptomyces sp. NPDC012617]|uniref:hypothetical protein n=1 Tax=Streptomyces TaxID=1883 RepID=UPI0033E1F59E